VPCRKDDVDREDRLAERHERPVMGYSGVLYSGNSSAAFSWRAHQRVRLSRNSTRNASNEITPSTLTSGR
jgi:hypothetical protein